MISGPGLEFHSPDDFPTPIPDVRKDYLGNLPLMKKDKDDEYISTREAGKMLGISLSTVTRYFEKGILTGEKNPITNWRSVSRKSVLALMKKYGIKERIGTERSTEEK